MMRKEERKWGNKLFRSNDLLLNGVWMSVRCPKCGRGLSNKPLKTWKFRFYNVGRYECPHCKTKFNIYESPKSKFVIFRKRRK